MLKFLATALLAGAAFAVIETDENVLVLTDANFDEAVETYENLLVEFYAPWCGHCKNLAPHYAAAATFFEGNADFDVKLGKVDATENNDIAKSHDVSGYPTLKYFKDGEAMDYTGGRTEDEIIAWLKKKTGPAAMTIDNADAFELLIKGDEVVVILAASDVTQENTNAKAFLKLAGAYDDAVFAVTTDPSIIGEEAGDDTIVLFKPFDEKRVKYQEKINKSKLTKFVNENILPTVIEFNDNVASKVFGGSVKEHVLYFRDASVDGDEATIEAFRTVGKEYKGTYLFVAVDLTSLSNKRIADFFGIKGTDPTVRIININGNPLKYAPEELEITEENFRSFVQTYAAGDLEPSLNSEEIPDNWDEEEVKIIVGKNFKDVVLAENKNVLLMAHAPWCGHCKSLVPVWDELAETFEENDSIMIAKMDATANEVTELSVQSFPTIKFFPAGGKDVVDFEGERDLKALTDFINKHSVEVPVVNDEL